MGLFLSPITQGKGMFLKKNSVLFLFAFFILFSCNNLFANEKDIARAIKYLENLKSFSSSFIQNDGQNLSEGELFIGKERIRVEYIKPTKILIIMSKNKAMYYDYELEEDEFFDPKNTSAWFFFDIFNNPNLLIKSKISKKNNYLIIKKEGINELGSYQMNIHFEDSPLLIRKITLHLDDIFLDISIFNHNYNIEYNNNFFKLISPNFFKQSK